MGPSTLDAVWDRRARTLACQGHDVPVGAGGRALENAAAQLARCLHTAGLRPRRIAVRDTTGTLRLTHHLPPEPPKERPMAERVEEKPKSNVTDATFSEHYRAIRDASKEQQRATAVMRLARKRAKAAGIILSDLDQAIRLRDLDSDERDVHLKNVGRYAAWLGCPLGTQGAIFGDAEAPREKVATELLEHDAREKGWNHGLHGGKEDGNPFVLGTPVSVAWAKGHADAVEFMKGLGDDTGEKKVTGSRRKRGNPEDAADVRH